MSGADPERWFRPGRWLLGRGWWALPLLLCVALSVPWVCAERWYSDASYYQAIATQMAREGGSTWWSPMQGDHHYFNKPPLAFWIHAALVLVFGDANWAAHLPEKIAFAGVCLLTGWMARRMHGPVVGVLAGCIMALTNEWIIRVGNFKLDSLHTLFLLGAMACWVRAFVPESDPAGALIPTARKTHARDERVGWGGGRIPRILARDLCACAQFLSRHRELGWALAAGACIGAALMTKPFYGASVGALALVWLWLAGVWSARRAVLVIASVLAGVLIAAPWHTSMIATHGQKFMQAYIHEQTVQRAIGEMHDRQPWDWYFKLILGTVSESIEPRKMWPIYGLAVAGLVVVVVVVAARWRARATRAGDALAALWTIAWLGALSAFGGKRNYYLMVVHPGTAWLAGIALDCALRRAAIACGHARVQSLLRGAAVAGLLAGVILLARAPLLVAKGRRELPVPERNEFMAFIRSQHGAGRDIYDCGLSYRIASLAYIQAGFWPKCPSERTGFTPDAVPAGALMAYKDDMLAKAAFGTFVDPRDQLVFRSSPNGQYTVYERHAGAIPVIGATPVTKRYEN